MTVSSVLEACLYASDLHAAEQFYTSVLGFEVFSRVAGRHVFFRCGSSMFLIFNPSETSRQQSTINDITVPMHGAVGSGHIAFAVADAEIPVWRERLTQLAVTIEAEIAWPRGGRSLYVRDPAGNSVELASPRIWGLPEGSGVGQ